MPALYLYQYSCWSCWCMAKGSKPMGVMSSSESNSNAEKSDLMSPSRQVRQSPEPGSE
jgi:hypothetical protein